MRSEDGDPTPEEIRRALGQLTRARYFAIYGAVLGAFMAGFMVGFMVFAR